MDHLTTDISIQCLAKNQHSLLRKFYRTHKSSMRITPQAQAWVARKPSIVAGACLSPVDNGYWLTSLYTAPEFRQQGVASVLIRHLQNTYQDSPIWLFCHPNLQGFYASLNFEETQQLPRPLSQRLTRYQQTKTLISMLYTQHFSTH